MALTTSLERDMISVRQAIARLSSIKLGPTSTPTFGSLALTSSLGVASGGTGASSLTDHSLLVGSGTDAVTALGVATNGQLPIGSTGADPVLKTLTEGAGISITNGAGSITIAASDNRTFTLLDGGSSSSLPTDSLIFSSDININKQNLGIFIAAYGALRFTI